MRRQHLFVLTALVLGLAFGTAIGYWIGTDGQSNDRSRRNFCAISEDEAKLGPAGLPSNRPAVDHTPKPASTGVTSNTGPQAAGSAEYVPGKPSLRDALDALEIASVPKGTESVSGVITDLEGRPVQGFQLTLSQEVSELYPPYPTPDKIKDASDRQVALIAYQYICERMRRDATQTVASDSLGQITFGNLRAVSSRLSFGPCGFMLDNGSQTMSVPVKVGESFHFRVVKLAAVRVKIDAPDLQPNVPCQIRYKPVGAQGLPGSRGMKPNLDTEILLAPGTYTVQAYCDGPKLIGTEQTVEVSAGNANPQLTLTLESPRVIMGTIHFPGGRPRGFSLLGAPVSGSFTDDELLSTGRVSRAVRLEWDNSTGTFAWDPGGDGQFVIGIRMGERLLASQRVTLAGQSLSIDLTIAPRPGATSLRLKIIHPEKTSLSNLSISLLPSQPEEYVRHELWELGAKEYLLVLETVNRKPMPARAFVAARTYELGAACAEFRPGADTEVILTFQQPCQLGITVKGLPEGVSWPSVRFLKSGGPSEGGSVGLTHFRGAEYTSDARVPGIQPGSYRAMIMLDHGEGFALLNQEVTLTSGTQALDLTLPTLSAVKLDGTSCKPYSHAQIEQKLTAKKVSFVFNDDGTALFPVLPPGEYTVTYTAGGIHGKRVAVTFTLPGTETVVLTD